MTSQSVKQQVLMRFAQLSGLEIDKAEGYIHLCTAAADEYLVRLKRVPDESQKERLLDLFASDAYHRYCCLMMARQRYSSMSLSDVSVESSLKTSCAAALTLKELSLEGCADLLTPKSAVVFSV